MSGASQYAEQSFLNWMTGKAAMPAKPTAYLALFTAVGTDDGVGFTEVTGGAYARQATAAGDWNAASGMSPASASNLNTISFLQATADWGVIIAAGLYDAVSGGNLLGWDYLGNFPWLPAEISSASPGVITAKAHGFAVADNVVFSTEYGGTAPSFSQSNFTGGLVVAHQATDTFDVTNGGTQVNTSSTGSGSVRKYTKQSNPTGVQAIFTAGQVVITVA